MAGTLREQLRSLKRSVRGRRWIVKHDSKTIREVKMLFNPDEYTGSRTLLTDKKLLKILDNEFFTRNK
jgi:hypothetical protein